MTETVNSLEQFSLGKWKVDSFYSQAHILLVLTQQGASLLFIALCYRTEARPDLFNLEAYVSFLYVVDDTEESKQKKQKHTHSNKKWTNTTESRQTTNC